MPKRLRSKTPQKSKRLSVSNNKSVSIPTKCKNSTSEMSDDVDLGEKNTIGEEEKEGVSVSSGDKNVESKSSEDLNVKEKYQIRENEKEKEGNMSSEDIDIVYDLQEDKKNRVYEVINVPSDDETPDKITYERLYANEPEKEVARESEVPMPVQRSEQEIKSLDPDNSTDILRCIDVLRDGDVLNEIAMEGSLISEKLKENDIGPSKKANGNKDKTVAHCSTVKYDSDDEVVCLDVKKDIIELITVSSGDETDSTPESTPDTTPDSSPYSSPPRLPKVPFDPCNISICLICHVFCCSNKGHKKVYQRITPYRFQSQDILVCGTTSSSSKAPSPDEVSNPTAPGTLSRNTNGNSSKAGSSESRLDIHHNYSLPASSSRDEEPSISQKGRH